MKNKLSRGYLFFNLRRQKNGIQSLFYNSFILVSFGVLLFGVIFPTKTQAQLTITVNSAGDGSDADGGVNNVCGDANGNCTLRAAIETHNQHAFQNVTNTIKFNIPLAGIVVIKPALPYQNISGQLIIDGFDQTGNFNEPLIEIDGSNAGAGTNGFTIVGGCTIRFLSIHSFNGRGIWIRATGGVAENNLVANNFIGTDATGTVDKGNGKGGVLISASFSATGNIIRDNRITGNGGPGVEISGGGGFPFTTATNNRVVGNTIGGLLQNDGEGVLIHEGAQENQVENNTIANNKKDGVRISGANTDKNKVFDNRIGIRGVTANPNEKNGVAIDSSAQSNEIGGPPRVNFDFSNTISGNKENGVLITGAATTKNKVFFNCIGTDADGNLPVANEKNGVAIEAGAALNIIGENLVGNGFNVISGNAENGVLITGAGTDNNSVGQNLIGTNAAEAAPVPNTKNGVLIQGGAKTNKIGVGIGESNFANNISGNLENGILISGAGTDENELRYNIVGTVALPNQKNGVLVQDDAKMNQLRLLDISGNKGQGIVITGLNSVRNRISNCFIVNNTGLGIDLGSDGVTPNDEGPSDLLPFDIDNGPNELQNFPTLNEAKVDAAGNTTIKGILKSTPNTVFHLEFFSNTACDPSGFGEGEGKQVHFDAVTTDAEGNGPFTVQMAGLAVGDVLTATATDPAGNTSEFSACRTVAAAGGGQGNADLEMSKLANKTQLTVGEQVTFTVRLFNRGPDAASNVAVKDAAPAGLTFNQVTTGAGSYNAITGVWTVPSLGAGADATLTVVATATQTGTIINTAEVIASDQIDPDSSPNNGNAAEDDQSSASVQVQAAATFTFYRDADNDGYGDNGNKIVSTSPTPPAGYVSNNTDCNDNDAAINPGATEVCDDKDNNCNGQIDEGVKTTFYRDTDGDGFGSNAQTVQACTPPLGYVATGGDCNDADNTIFPGAPEMCNDNKDNNCNGQVDEACANITVFILPSFAIEGDKGRRPMFFIIVLNKQSTSNVSVQYKTIDGSAKAGQDYQAASGTLTFGRGQLIKFITVFVLGDNLTEGTERFTVQLHHPVNLNIGGTGTATGNIIDDDGLSNENVKATAVQRAQLAKALAQSKVTDGLILNAFPNPGNGEFTMQVFGDDAKGHVQLRVVDAVGRTVEARSVPAISVLRLGSGYRPGVYFIQAVQGTESVRLKLVKISN